MDNRDLLACQRCTRLKTRCSKEYPSCAQCLKHNDICIPVSRARRPRGRNGGRHSEKAELSARIAHLEDLVKSMGEKMSNHPSPEKDEWSYNPSRHSKQPQSISSQQQSNSHHLGQVNGHTASAPLGQSLFAQLSEELVGIREILDESISDEGMTESPRGVETDDVVHQSSRSWFFPESASSPFQAVPRSEEVLYLLSIFRRRVHPLLKAVHLPTFESEVRTTLIERQTWNEDPHVSGAHAAAFYVAVASLSDWECRQNLGFGQTELWKGWRTAVEQRLASSHFLTSERLETLQTLIFYLVCMSKW